ncbi:hypothetical protein AVEN_40102-1 [Araneus ventricosus]|uniref:Uncharacterized protein n=1 Tax=Araneus ventricosus TaxID=182803 RepID=A0A4Y2J1T4_ARAVE|nr:hypothetical protein AVEN_40102-1 [Araneus ventricosus]
MIPCLSNSTTSPFSPSLHSSLAEAPIQSMTRAGEAGQEQGQAEQDIKTASHHPPFSREIEKALLRCTLEKNLSPHPKPLDQFR